jgi:hypothetical protein
MVERIGREVYEESWKELAFEKALTFPDSFKVSELMLATARRTAAIEEEAVKEVIEDGQDEKSWMTRELNGVALHTTDLDFFGISNWGECFRMDSCFCSHYRGVR